MSEYRRDYCPICEATTDHEDGCCMECGRGPLESVREYYDHIADEEHAERMQKVREDEEV